MGLYRNVRTRILMNESSCTLEQLAELKSKFAIEARPAEKIRRPAQLIEELEERLVLEPEDDDAHSHNWRVLREIAVILGIDCTDFPEVLAADPLPPPVLPIADLSPRLIEALADTFCRLPEGETKRFLRLLGIPGSPPWTSDTAVIIVGWGHGRGDIFSFWRAAANTRYTGQALYQVLKMMHSVVGRPLRVHCAGHSLGAHVCGFAGKHLLADPDHPRPLDRISGMDPAGPLFCNDVPYPFNHLDVKPTSRLGHRHQAVQEGGTQEDRQGQFVTFLANLEGVESFLGDVRVHKVQGRPNDCQVADL